MGRYTDSSPFLTDLPSLELISGWESHGGFWQFRLLNVCLVLHNLRVVDGRIQIFSEATRKWEPLGLLDMVPVEHRPIKEERPIPWPWFYRRIGLPCPEYLIDRRIGEEPADLADRERSRLARMARIPG